MKILKLKQKGYKIYRRPQFAFGINNFDVFLVTELQTFRLEIDHPSQRKELKSIIDKIVNRKIKKISDVVALCGYRPNDNVMFSYFLGVNLSPIKLEWYI